MFGKRLVDTRRIPRYVRYALIGVGAFAAVLAPVMLDLWKHPENFSRGRRNPWLHSKIGLVLAVFASWVVLSFVGMLVVGFGLVGMVYGRARAGRVRVGSSWGMLGCWWRRIDCVSPTEVEFMTTTVSPETVLVHLPSMPSFLRRFLVRLYRPVTQNLVYVRSGGRAVRMRSHGSFTAESKTRFREWLEENGVQVTVLETARTGYPPKK